MEENYMFLDGKFVLLDQAALPVTDLLIQRGYGIFDFFLVRDNKPRFMPDHLDRFIHSAKLMDLKLKHSKKELAGLVEELVAKNNCGNSSIKLMLTGGFSPDDFTLAGNDVLMIINKPFELKVTDAQRNGGTLISCNYQREIPQAKSVNYLRSVRLSRELAAVNGSEILFVDRGLVRECSRSNIFMVKDGCAYTPKSGVLYGVTRKRILRTGICRMVEMDFSFKELLHADEAFISSTTKGVWPIVRIDKSVIADGKPGPISSAIRDVLIAE